VYPHQIVQNGRTVLHWAAEQGKLEIVRMLLAHGADTCRVAKVRVIAIADALCSDVLCTAALSLSIYLQLLSRCFICSAFICTLITPSASRSLLTEWSNATEPQCPVQRDPGPPSALGQGGRHALVGCPQKCRVSAP